MQLSSSMWSGGLLTLLALVTHILASETRDLLSDNLPDTLSDNLPDTTRQTPRCLCTVDLDDSRSPYNMGEIKSYDDLTVNAATDKTTCRKLRHQCRHECALHADLNKPTEGSSSLGYTLCVHHGQVTSGVGVGVSSYAVLEGCPQHIPIKATVATQRLCCGHTAITINTDQVSHTNKQYFVFGWNPDCRAQTYVLH